MSFLLGLLVGLAAGVMSYLLFAASSRNSAVIVNNTDSGSEEVQPTENFESLLLIRDAVNSLSVGVVVVGTDGVADIGFLAVLLGQLHAQDGVRQLGILVGHLADVVQ